MTLAVASRIQNRNGIDVRAIRHDVLMVEAARARSPDRIEIIDRARDRTRVRERRNFLTRKE
jgi:hypothetical protein